MSELDIKPIVSPRLSIPGYGKGVDDAFKAIEQNFRIIANHDFIKGDRGYSLCSVDYPILSDIVKENGIITDGTFTETGVSVLEEALKTVSTDASLTTLYKDLGLDWNGLPTWKSLHDVITNQLANHAGTYDSGINWDSIKPTSYGAETYTIIDSLLSDDVFKVIETYDPSAAIKVYTPVASLNMYMFRDVRFSNKNISSIDLNKYSGLLDLSKVLYIQANTETGIGQMTSLNILPCLYYNSETETFCWKINGEETGMIAQGPAGNDGKTSKFFIFKIDSFVSGNKTIYRAYSISNSDATSSQNTWRPITENDLEDMSTTSTCIVVARVNDGSGSVNNTQIFFSNIISKGIENGKPYVEMYCDISADSGNNFGVSISVDWLETIMTSHINASDSTKGIHLPYDISNETGRSQGYRHMMRSVESGDSNNLNVLRVSPLYYGWLTGDNTSQNIYSKSGILKLDYASTIIGQPNVDASGKESNGDYFKSTFTNSETGSSLIVGNNTSNCTITNASVGINYNSDYIGMNVTDLNGQVYGVVNTSTKTEGKTSPILFINSGNSLSQGGSMIIGSIDGSDIKTKLLFTDDTIQALEGSQCRTLHLNRLGGDVEIGGQLITGSAELNGDVLFNGSATFNSAVNLNKGMTSVVGIKTGGVTRYSWIDSCKLEFNNSSVTDKTSNYISSYNNHLHIGANELTIASSGDWSENDAKQKNYDKYTGNIDIIANSTKIIGQAKCFDGLAFGRFNDLTSRDQGHRRWYCKFSTKDRSTKNHAIDASHHNANNTPGIYYISEYISLINTRTNPDMYLWYKNFAPGSILIFDYIFELNKTNSPKEEDTGMEIQINSGNNSYYCTGTTKFSVEFSKTQTLKYSRLQGMVLVTGYKTYNGNNYFNVVSYPASPWFQEMTSTDVRNTLGFIPSQYDSTTASTSDL